MAYRLKNATDYSFGLAHGFVHPPKSSITLVVKATYTIVPNKPGKASPKQDTITGDVFENPYDPYTNLVTSSDLQVYKPQGEIILQGTCYAPKQKPVPLCSASIQVATVNKTLHVIGKRTWKVGIMPGVAVSSDPEPFVAMPLDYKHAFGGPQPPVEGKQGYPPNPAGIGYFTHLPEPGDPPQELPNVEAPSSRIATWNDRPMPAGFGPLNPFWSQRIKKAGTYDRNYRRESWPFFPKDFDWRYFNAAPDDQQLSGFFSGDEQIDLKNLHPKHEQLVFNLPGERIRIFVVLETTDRKDPQKKEQQLVEVAAPLDTVTVFPDGNKFTQTWRGVLDVSAPQIPEVREIWICSEAVGEPKTVEQCKQDADNSFALKAAAAGLGPLPGISGALPEKEDQKKQKKKEKKQQQEQQSQDEQRIQQVQVKMLGALDALTQKFGPAIMEKVPDDVQQQEATKFAELVDGDPDSPEFKAKLDKILLEAKAKGEEAQQQGRAHEEERGVRHFSMPEIPPIAPDTETKQKLHGLRKEIMGLKRKSEALNNDMIRQKQAGTLDEKAITQKLVTDFAPKLEAIKGKLATLVPAGVMADVEDQVNNPLAKDAKKSDGGKNSGNQDDNKKESGQENQSGDAKSGDQQQQAPPSGDQQQQAAPQQQEPAAPDSGQAKAVAGAAAGVAGAGAVAAGFAASLMKKKKGDAPAKEEPKPEDDEPLTREKVIEMHGKGQSLKNRQIIKIDLSKLDLSGIDLSSTQCLGVNFAETSLAGAKMGSGNFQGCDFSGSSLKGAKASDAMFSECPMNKTDHTGADYSKAKFFLDKFPDNNFTQANLKEAIFNQGDLSGCIFTGADCTDAVFVKMKMPHCDFKQAKLKDARCLIVDAQGTDYTGADCTGFRANADCNMTGIQMASNQADGSLWDGANLTGADFSGAHLDGATFNFADLTKASLRGTSIAKGSFMGAVISESDLYGAQLMKCNFQRADISKSNFSQSNLYGSDFLFSQIKDSFFVDTNVTKTILESS